MDDPNITIPIHADYLKTTLIGNDIFKNTNLLSNDLSIEFREIFDKYLHLSENEFEKVLKFSSDHKMKWDGKKFKINLDENEDIAFSICLLKLLKIINNLSIYYLKNNDNNYDNNNYDNDDNNNDNNNDNKKRWLYKYNIYIHTRQSSSDLENLEYLFQYLFIKVNIKNYIENFYNKYLIKQIIGSSDYIKMINGEHSTFFKLLKFDNEYIESPIKNLDGMIKFIHYVNQKNEI